MNFSFVCYTLHFSNPYIIERKMLILKYLVMYFSVLCYFISLRSKYNHLHFVGQLIFHAHTKQQIKLYILVHYILCF
jgi:hypothetical protein